MSWSCIIKENTETHLATPDSRPICCFAHGVPFLFPELIHVLLAIAHYGFGADPQACKLCSTNSHVFWHSVGHRSPFITPAAHHVHHCYGMRQGFPAHHQRKTSRMPSILSHVFSLCPALVQGFYFRNKELVLGDPPIYAQGRHPIGSAPIAGARSRFQNMECKTSGPKEA